MSFLGKDTKGGDYMNIGFIGAGKVGFSLGKYLKLNQHFLSGYYSQNLSSSLKAAEFTDSKQFTNIKNLVGESDIIFLTVPDSALATVSQEISQYPVAGKIFCHCSGAFNHEILSELEAKGAFTFSVHPFLAISDKYTSYQDLSKAFFTIEGNLTNPLGLEKKEIIEELIKSCHNSYQFIDSKDKVKYHTSAVFASNLMIGLVDMATNLLLDCGFSRENANQALSNILESNLSSIINKGCENALTGPIERNDYKTVISHLDCLSQKDSYKEAYKALSKQLVLIASKKHPDRDYSIMNSLLDK